MANFVAEGPERADVSTSTADLTAEEMQISSTEDVMPTPQTPAQAAATAAATAATAAAAAAAAAVKDPAAYAAASDAALNPRFRLGLETGRWFTGSGGDVYELLDAIGSGSASTVFKCKIVAAANAPQQQQQQQKHAAEDTILAVKAIDLKGLRLNRNLEEELGKLRKEVRFCCCCCCCCCFASSFSLLYPGVAATILRIYYFAISSLTRLFACS